MSTSDTTGKTRDSSWTLYYSDEGYPYYFNHLTNESSWAELPKLGENQAPSAPTGNTTDSRSDDQDDDSDEDDDTDDNSSEDDEDPELEEQFRKYIASPDGELAMKMEQELIEDKLNARFVKQQEKLQRLAFKKTQEGASADSASSSESDSDSDMDSLSSDDSDVQEALKPLLPNLADSWVSLKLACLDFIYDYADGPGKSRSVGARRMKPLSQIAARSVASSVQLMVWLTRLTATSTLSVCSGLLSQIKVVASALTEPDSNESTTDVHASSLDDEDQFQPLLAGATSAPITAHQSNKKTTGGLSWKRTG